MSFISRLRAFFLPGGTDAFPDAGFELVEHRHLFKGRVLNAGAGWRDISHLIDGELINLDLAYPDDKRTNLHIVAPLHEIPVSDAHFDAVICVAVLEHVANPAEVMTELFRVIKPAGSIVLSVPFLQPEHKCPTDYQRYTKDGLVRLLTVSGFEVTSVVPQFSVYHTLYWIVWEWLHLKRTFSYRLLRLLLLRPLLMMAQNSDLQSERLASSFQIIGRKAIARDDH